MCAYSIIKRRIFMDTIEFRFDVQLLIEGQNMSEDDIGDYVRGG